MSGQIPAVAVIGASGFLGAALVRAARSAMLPCTPFTRAVPFVDDAGRPAEGLRAAGTIFWVAGSFTPALAEAEPHRITADRAVLSSLLAAVARLDHGPRVVLASSGGTVYDPAVPPPYREDSPTSPRGAYGRAKLDQEAQLRAVNLGPGRAVVVRIANAYGPGQRGDKGQGVVGRWLRAAAQGDPLVIVGDPATTRDYVYVDDVAQALLAVAAADKPPTVLNLGSGEPTTLDELAAAVQRVTGRAEPPEYRPARAFDVPRTWLDIGLARRALGWSPATSLADGLAATWKTVAAERPGPG